MFGGPAWTRVTEADGTPGQWYLHLFDIKQPDLDWLERRGPRRVRVDPALLVRPRRRRLPHRRRPRAGQGSRDARPRRPVRRRRAGRRRASALGPRRGPRRVPPVAGDQRRVRRRAGLRRRGLGADRRAPGPLPAARTSCTRRSTSISCWRRGTPPRCARRSTRASTPSTRSAPRRRGCCRTTTSCVTSPATAAGSSAGAGPGGGAADARAARWRLRLPGRGAGPGEVTDLPDEVRQDPAFLRTGGKVTGRDGCRVPIPWSGTSPPFGFGPGRGQPGCPSRPSGRELTVERQEDDPASMLALYRDRPRPCAASSRRSVTAA